MSQLLDQYPSKLKPSLSEAFPQYLASFEPAYHANGVLLQSSSSISLYFKESRDRRL